jgi:hypothetical protein
VNELKQVAIDSSGEESFHDCLPAGTMAKFIGALTSSARVVGTGERITDAKFRKLLVVAEPQLPIELLDTLITILRNLVNRGIGLRRLVLLLEVQWDGPAPSFFEECEIDETRRGIVFDINGKEVRLVLAERACSAVNGEGGNQCRRSDAGIQGLNKTIVSLVEKEPSERET